MKIRNGFVSNSSSSSFILDKRNISEEMLEIINGLQEAKGCGRYTAKAIGKKAVQYANDWIVEFGKYSDEPGSLGPWILEWANKLGEENVVFVRKSDEDFDNEYSHYLVRDLRGFAESEMEYH